MNGTRATMNKSRLRKKLLVVVLLFFIFLLLQSSIVWKWMFPVKYEDEIMHHSQEHRIDPYFMMAIIRVESKFDPERTSKKGAIGLMQIMPETAKWAAQTSGIDYQNDNQLWETNTNLALGAWYISYLHGLFNGNMLAVAAAYNAGQNKVVQWMEEGVWTGDEKGIENIPYGETRHYIQKVTYYHKQYNKIYGG